MTLPSELQGFLVSALNYIKLVNSSSSGKSVVEIDDRKVKEE